MSAPRASRARRCVSTRRRPMASPPGLATSAAPQRASSGPARRIEARILRDSSVSGFDAMSPSACNRTTLVWTRSTATPMPSRICSITRTSWMSGRLRNTIGSSVSRHAARIGSAAFLLPPGRMVPSRRRPPSTMNRSIGIPRAIVSGLRYHRPVLVAPLGSGSAGNAYYFESDGTSILVDAGFGPRETRRRLEQVGRDIEQLRGIVLTHEHHDHIRGAERIARQHGIPIYLTQGTLDASDIDRLETPTVVFRNDSSFVIGELEIHARRTLHDAADPACFVIESRDGTRVGIASDLGYADDPVVQHLRRCDGLFFESNHDLDMLRMGTYPWSLKRRIMSRFGHLSNDDSMHAVQRKIGADLK